MKFFAKIGKSRKNLIIGFLSIIVVLTFIVTAVKLKFLPELTSNKNDLIDGTVIENDNNELLSEQESNDSMENSGDSELADGDSAKKYLPFIVKPRTPGSAYDDDTFTSRIYDLLYRYEPYYIYEGYNYHEMRTPNQREIDLRI
jgi:hypothetical protein